MKTIQITATRTYTKTAVVEIPCPSDLPLEDILDYLYTNNGLWEDNLENKIGEANLEGDFNSDETRYDVIETRTLISHVYGGTL